MEGNALEALSTVMSTAEAVSVGFAAVMHAYYYDYRKPKLSHVVQSLSGSALKDFHRRTPRSCVTIFITWSRIAKGARGRNTTRRATCCRESPVVRPYSTKRSPGWMVQWSGSRCAIILRRLRGLVRECIARVRPKAVLIEGPADFNPQFTELHR